VLKDSSRVLAGEGSSCARGRRESGAGGEGSVGAVRGGEAVEMIRKGVSGGLG